MTFIEVHGHDGSGYYDHTNETTQFFKLLVLSPSRHAGIEEFYFNDRYQAEAAACYLSGPHGGYQVGLYSCKHSDIVADKYITNWAEIL